jgi:hypothetical protein
MSTGSNTTRKPLDLAITPNERSLQPATPDNTRQYPTHFCVLVPGNSDQNATPHARRPDNTRQNPTIFAISDFATESGMLHLTAHHPSTAYRPYKSHLSTHALVLMTFCVALWSCGIVITKNSLRYYDLEMT